MKTHQRHSAKKSHEGEARVSSASKIPIIDLHAHFPMQLPLPKRPCDTLAQSKRNQLLMDAANAFANFENPLTPRFRLAPARQTGVNFGSVLYQPADDLFGPCYPFDNLTKQISLVNDALKKGKVTLASNPKDLTDLIQNGKPAAFHCLEGGFSVGDPSNVPTLADAGVAYIILAHLVFREVSANVNAIPFMSDAEYDRMFPMPTAGLTGTGIEICEEMCKQGIIPDVTHASEAAICDVFAIADANTPKRPVIVSHGAPRGNAATEYKLNLSEATIKGIRDRGGVIGVIFYDHWLLPVDSPSDTETSSQTVVDAINKIADIAGTTECIAIGSDLDGFIKPVKGLENVSKMRNLENALRNSGRYDEDVQGILWKNALRTLCMGWAAGRKSR
jgi:membrane dipeptidase